MVGWIVMVMVMISCKDHRNLTNEQYTDIIVDLQLAESIMTNTTVKNKDSLKRAIHDRIATVYGFKNSDELISALQPLTLDPQKMLDVTKLVSKQLERLADSSITNTTTQ